MNQVAPDGEAAVPASLLAFRSGLNALDRVSYWAIVLVMAGMVILVSAQVGFRYVLSSSIDSADELARLLFIWATFLAIPHGVRYGVHVGIDLFLKLLSPRIEDIVFRGTAIAGAVLMILVFWFGIAATADKWSELMPTLPITAGVFYCAVVVSAGHSFLHLVLLVVGGQRIWGDERL